MAGRAQSRNSAAEPATPLLCARNDRASDMDAANRQSVRVGRISGDKAWFVGLSFAARGDSKSPEALSRLVRKVSL